MCDNFEGYDGFKFDLRCDSDEANGYGSAQSIIFMVLIAVAALFFMLVIYYNYSVTN